MQQRWPRIPAHLLGPQRIPFPVSVPHRVRPDLYKLEPREREQDAGREARNGESLADDAAGLLRVDRHAPRYLREKEERLGDALRPLVLLSPGADVSACAGALVHAIATLAEAHPDVITMAPGIGDGVGDAPVPSAHAIAFATSGIGLRPAADGQREVVALREDVRAIVARLAPLPEPRRTLAALALSLQEDLVLMAFTGEGFVSEAMSVVFPSGWDPAEKIGRPLFQIHAPVADGDALRAASDNLARAMVEKGPYVRYVWTIADSDALARMPGHANAGVRPEEMFFRCERQVTLPLASHRRSLFLIRVFVAPLTEVANEPARRELLVRVLESMPDEVLRYKGLTAIREVLRTRWSVR